MFRAELGFVWSYALHAEPAQCDIPGPERSYFWTGLCYLMRYDPWGCRHAETASGQPNMILWPRTAPSTRGVFAAAWAMQSAFSDEPLDEVACQGFGGRAASHLFPIIPWALSRASFNAATISSTFLYALTHVSVWEFNLLKLKDTAHVFFHFALCFNKTRKPYTGQCRLFYFTIKNTRDAV